MRFLLLLLLVAVVFASQANGVEFRLYTTVTGDLVAFMNLNGDDLAGAVVPPSPSGINAGTLTGWGLNIWDLPDPVWSERAVSLTAIPASGWVWFKLPNPSGLKLGNVSAKFTPFLQHAGTDININTGAITSTAFLNNNNETVLPDGNWPLVTTGLPILVTPTISNQTGSLNIRVNERAEFTVVGHSLTPIPSSYQWFKDNVIIGGATNTQYVVASVSAGNTGSYTCKVTDTVGEIISQPALLTIDSTIDSTVPKLPVGSTATLILGVLAIVGFAKRRLK